MRHTDKHKRLIFKGTGFYKGRY